MQSLSDLTFVLPEMQDKADKEEIDIRYYSIIYAAIDDLKDAMEGMLAPEMKEEVLGTAEIREIFKISKVGSIAGCMVMDGKMQEMLKSELSEMVLLFMKVKL
jgi:translation initiation factor IF-2